MKKVVVEIKDLEHISPIFKGKIGLWLGKKAMNIFGIDRVNRLYSRSANLKGVEFTNHVLKDLGVKCEIGHVERLNHLPEGAFITISNHPYGGLDGVMIVDIIASYRPDYKFMVNELVYMIEALRDHFISVIPRLGNKKPDPLDDYRGIKQTLTHLKQGKPVGFFPAGAVSMFHFNTMDIHDREWQAGILKIIQFAKVPIVPIRFFDTNSWLFYFLGVINWRIRLVRMSYELFNKNKKPHRIGIGETIMPDDLASIKDIKELERYLRKAVYEMPMPNVFTARKQ